MATNPAYNGVRAKELNQINTPDGKACVAYSAPDFFIKDQNLFAPKRTGNEVHFFTTGEDYFKDVAAAIDSATQTIFITGWQINYDVLLDGKRSLWQCLHQALQKQTGLTIYVMPWLSPSGSIGTYDFETMLAIFQLNAGLVGGARAFCTPAIQQSDMQGLGATFSHHQKSVVIDNQKAYVGGIDLAYGRRDDNNFSLDASTRQGNDAYNPGLPHLGWMALDKHTSRSGLMMASLFDLSKPLAQVTFSPPLLSQNVQVALPISRSQSINGAAYIADFFQSPTADFIKKMGYMIEDVKKTADASLATLAATKRKIIEHSIRAIALLIRTNLDTQQLEAKLKQRITSWLKELDAAGNTITEYLRLKSTELISQWMSETDLGRVFTVVSGKSFEDLPPQLLDSSNELASSVLWHLHALLQERAGEHQQPYPYLHKSPQPLASHDNSCLLADQPRMPWQDVHSRIEGPSVYDLSRNFIDRWNGQQAYIADTPALQNTQLVRSLLQAVMQWLNTLVKDAGLAHYLDLNGLLKLELAKPQPIWINNPAQLPQPPTVKPGGVSVQVLRSASARMTQQEQVGRTKSGVNLPLPAGIDIPGSKQANCKSAMLQAISSAQHFIYIENQFFQSGFGHEAESRPVLSGPMASLRDPSSLNQALVARVNLRAALKAQDIWQLNWPAIDSIAKDPGAEAREFLSGLYAIWGGNAQGWLTHKLAKAQTSIRNDIGSALAKRIGRAIDENLPFHVYLVLPVHPEGALNVINIMHQVHLTMQSLLYGENSLVKTVQRRMALREQMDRGRPEEQARQGIEVDDGKGQPVYAQQDWSRYLTLLNLRTWDTIGPSKRVVTEQIYVHSKLLIADDRVAILGSANINDRSLLGERDSELAVIVRDSTPVSALLNGICPQNVGKAVQQLRIALWKKHFALSLSKKSAVQPASDLAQYLEQPAAEHTWRAIQKQATRNSGSYNLVFNFIPQNISQLQPLQGLALKAFPKGFPTSIWPTWVYRDAADFNQGGELLAPMPYEERFWQTNSSSPPNAFAQPTGVKGFITALPTNWTRGEQNDSGLNLTILADVGQPTDRNLASATVPAKSETTPT